MVIRARGKRGEEQATGMEEVPGFDLMARVAAIGCPMDGATCPQG